MDRSPFLPADTTVDADRAQREIYQRLQGAERVAIAFRLTTLVRETAIAGIRHRHPEYDEQQVQTALARLTLGDDIVRRVWPARELVAP